ncbi:MAG TPA: hypothetical protein VHH55_01955, partial [Gaiellaceae bacterium]|nr:hypothetical protein [Gaiellaceae bacterium]
MIESPPPPRHRPRPSRRRILLRRLLAFGFILGLLAVLIGSAWAVLGSGEEEPPPPPAPVAAAPKPL